MNLKNSTILITGGTSGIGLELVKQLTEKGAKIIITGRNREALDAARTKFPGIAIYQSDVSKPTDIDQLFFDVTGSFPHLNMIINNAGLMRLIDLRDTSMGLEDITREIDTNLIGSIQMVHRFLPFLLQKHSAAIVNVTSGIAFMAYSSAPVYSATKAGLRAYTQALRLQLQDTSVKVFEVIPPGVKTNLQNDWLIQPNPSMMMDADKMVEVIVKGLEKDRSEIKPFMLKVIKALSRIAPNMLIRFGHGEFKKFKDLSAQASKTNISNLM